jgi:hypothetical protein
MLNTTKLYELASNGVSPVAMKANKPLENV